MDTLRIAPSVTALVLVALTAASAAAQTANELLQLTGAPSTSTRHGNAVAIDGPTAIVGAPDVSAGNGEARIYRLGGGFWFQEAVLAEAGIVSFGESVDVSGDTAVVGAPFTNGSRGRAFVYVRSGSTWSLQATLQQPNPLPNDRFGIDVGIDGDRLAVGCPGIDFALGSIIDAGEALAYLRSGTTWSLVAGLTAPNLISNDQVGFTVDVLGDVVAVGAPLHQTQTGAVHVFTMSGSTITGSTTVGPFALGGYFGSSLALGSDYLVVGAPVAGSATGDVYVFPGVAPTYGSPVVLSGSTSNGEFGTSVAASGDILLVGQLRGDSGAGGYASEFVRTQGSWFDGLRLEPAANQVGSELASVALSGDLAVTGVPSWQQPGGDDGAAFVFGVPGTPFGFCDTGAPCGNNYPTGGCIYSNASGLGGRLLASGSTSVAMDDLRFVGYQLHASVLCVLIMSPQQQGPAAVGNGLTIIGSPAYRFAAANSVNGVIDYGPGLGALSTQRFGVAPAAGQTWYYQMWFRNPGGPCSGAVQNYTNACSIDFTN